MAVDAAVADILERLQALKTSAGLLVPSATVVAESRATVSFMRQVKGVVSAAMHLDAVNPLPPSLLAAVHRVAHAALVDYAGKQHSDGLAAQVMQLHAVIEDFERKLTAPGQPPPDAPVEVSALPFDDRPPPPTEASFVADIELAADLTRWATVRGSRKRPKNRKMPIFANVTRPLAKLFVRKIKATSTLIPEDEQGLDATSQSLATATLADAPTTLVPSSEALTEPAAAAPADARPAAAVPSLVIPIHLRSRSAMAAFQSAPDAFLEFSITDTVERTVGVNAAPRGATMSLSWRMPIFPQYTLYCVQMRTNMPEFGHTGDGDYSVLVIHRRYQEFADLYKQLQAVASSPSLLPPFPPKMAFGRFSAEVIEARRVELERFLQSAARSAALRASAALLTFCTHDQVQVNEEGDLIRMPSTQLDAERVATFFTPYSASNAPVVQDRARTLSDQHGGDEGRRIAVLEEGGAQLAVFESHLGRFRLRAASEDYVFYLLLCEERDPDPDFVSAFLLCFRHFMAPHACLQRLSQHLDPAPPEDATEEDNAYIERMRPVIQQRVVSVVRQWVELSPFDFWNSDMHDGLMAFIRYASVSVQPSWQADLQAITAFANGDRSVRAKAVALAVGSEYDLSAFPKDGNTNLLHVIQFLDDVIARAADHSEAASPLLHPARLITVPAEQLAQQLTLVETELFDAVTPVELLVRLWGHEEEGHNLAKRLEMLIAWFNQMSYWVARTVCTPNDAALRARCIEYFVAVADSCRLQHNLASVMAIIAGLSLSAVQRLSKTWAVVSEQALQTLQGIEQLLSPEANYSVYRAHVKRFRRSSCVPYVGLLLKDLTFINDGNPKRLENGSVNFAKAWQLFEVLSEFSNFQKHRIAIAPDPSIAQLLRSLPLPDEDFTYKASLAAEPRSPPPSESP